MIDFTHILQGYFAGTGAIGWLPQCQQSNPEEYGKISRTKKKNKSNHNKTKQLWDTIMG